MPSDSLPAADSARHRHYWRWAACIVLAVALAAVVVYRSYTFVSQPPPRRGRFREGANQPVGVATIGRGDIRLTLRALGAVTPLATVTVTTQINGLLMSVGFKEGDLVRKGQLLAQIDPRPYQVALEQDEAQLARDDATLKQAQMDLVRYRTLWQQQSIARQTYEDQEWTVKQDQGTVDYDKAQIKAQQLNLTYCRIVAPTDGRVGLRQVDPGNYVQTSSTTGIVVETMLKPTTVEFAVPEDSIPQIMSQVRSGSRLPVTAFDRANVTELATGQLGAVDTQVNSTTGTVMLRANFANDDQALYPGQFVNIVMLLDTLKNAVTVPVRAVQRGAPGSYVYLVDDDDIVSVHPITLGAQDGDFYAVTAGLSPGERVVTDGADRLRDGAKVTLSNTSPPEGTPGQGRQNASGHHGNWQRHRHAEQGDANPPERPQGQGRQPPRHRGEPADAAPGGASTATN